MSADEVEGEEEEEEKEENRVPESERREVGDKRLQCGNWSGSGVGGSARNEGRKEGSLEPLKSGAAPAPRRKS